MIFVKADCPSWTLGNNALQFLAGSWHSIFKRHIQNCTLKSVSKWVIVLVICLTCIFLKAKGRRVLSFWFGLNTIYNIAMLLKIVGEGYNIKWEGCDGLLWRQRRECVSQLWHKKGDKRKNWKLNIKELSPVLCTYTTIRSKITISMSLMKFKVGSTAYLGNEVSLEWRSQNVTTKERSLPGIVKPLLLTAVWRFSWILYAMKILNNVINLSDIINITLDLKHAVQSRLHPLC